MEAARKIRTLIQVKLMLGFHDPNEQTFPVKTRIERSEQLVDSVVDNGTELVSNVVLAAQHLQVQHCVQIEERNAHIRQVLKETNLAADIETKKIAKNWPLDQKTKAPMDMHARILGQKRACEELLGKRDEIIAMLEQEIADSDSNFKILVEEFHDNVSVLGSRMEGQVQALEHLVRTERSAMAEAFMEQRQEQERLGVRNWQAKHEAVERTAKEQMEARLRLLRDQQLELDELVQEDAEASTRSKGQVEAHVAKLNDQVLFLEAINQLNEERLDYEIHVLRKHEEEVVLVKSEQKRKITVLLDTINKLRQKVRASNASIAKEEDRLQEVVHGVRQQIDRLKVNKVELGTKNAQMRRSIEAMVLKEMEDLLGQIRRADAVLSQSYLLRSPKHHPDGPRPDPPPRAEQPATKSRPLFRPQPKIDPAAAGGHQPGPGGAQQGQTSSDLQTMISKTHMKKAMSRLVHEANFLVEDNLKELLARDPSVTEDEKKLFKLDSVLTTIGVRGEEEILEILKAGGGRRTGPNDFMMETIRAHVEKATAANAAGSLEVILDHGGESSEGVLTCSEASGGQRSDRQGNMGDDRWKAMLEEVAGFRTPAKSLLMDALKKYHAILKQRSAVSKEAARFWQQNEELRRLLGHHLKKPANTGQPF